VDDANRITQLGRILSLINDQTTNRKIKIIVTVRDYALNKVKEAAKESGKYVELFLNTIEDKQIKEIISSEYGIHNQIYIERICNIAKGNPRLAIMASRIASAERDLGSIADVSILYDEYFGSIVTDSSELNDTNLLKVAGIVSFFGSLDRTNQEHFSNIAAKFSISEELFWWNVKKLHSLEIVDLYEDDVVKITDQVLSTYLFYKAFIKDQILDFSILLDVFFYEHRLRDTVYPVISAFNKQFVTTRLQSHIDRKWESAKKDSQCLVAFMEVFWFLKQTDILYYYKELIDCIPDKEYVFSDFNFSSVKNSGRIDSHLEVLRLFGNSEKENFEIALELMFSYLEKVPSVLPDILHLFTEDFSFDSHSYIYDYIIQNTLVLKLIEKSQTDKKSDLYTEFY
jgi:hypothetical protein